MREFTTRQRDDLVFSIDGEEFRAVGTAPAGLFMDLAVASDNIARVRGMGDMLDAVLLPQYRERFAERLRSASEPIDPETLNEVFEMLAEHYGGRPTAPSGPSTNGAGHTGESSTATQSGPASISPASPSTAT